MQEYRSSDVDERDKKAIDSWEMSSTSFTEYCEKRDHRKKMATNELLEEMFYPILRT